MDVEPSRVRAVVINYNGAGLTANCVASLSRQTWTPLDIVVVDAHSRDSDWEELRRLLPEHIVLHRIERSCGYARSINIGARLKTLPRPGFTLAMNNDVILPDHGTIRKLVEALQQDPLRVAASPLIRHVGVHLHPEAAVQVRRVPDFNTLLIAHSGALRRLPFFRRMSDQYTYAEARPYLISEVFDCETINGALFLLRTEFLCDIGYLDEHTFLFMEELILGAQTKRCGRTACLVTSVTVDHLQGAATLSTPRTFRLRMFLEQTRSEIYYVRQYLSGGVLQQALLVFVRMGDALGKIVCQCWYALPGSATRRLTSHIVASAFRKST
jgi:GT2 family glycosyltransferase